MGGASTLPKHGAPGTKACDQGKMSSMTGHRDEQEREVEQLTEAEERETERRGEQLREAWRRHHPQREREDAGGENQDGGSRKA